MSAGPWLSKYNFLGLGSIEFKVIGVGPLFDMLDLGLLAGIIRYMSSAYSRMTLRDDTGCRSEAVTTRGRPYNRTLDYMLVDILHATVIFQSGNVTGNC